MNPKIRGHLAKAIGGAVEQSRLAIEEDHPGLAGEMRELALNKLLTPMLPVGVGIGTGKIVDSQGGESRQIDAIIYNKESIPPALYGHEKGLFPIEACLAAVEIKTTATAQTLADSYEKAVSIMELAPWPRSIVRFPSGECR